MSLSPLRRFTRENPAVFFSLFGAATAAINQSLSPPFRTVLWKVLGLTAVLLAVAWTALDKLALRFVTPLVADHPWLHWTVSVVTGIGLVFALAYIVAPISMIVAGLFVDDLAERVERDEPGVPIGRPLPTGSALWLASKFGAVSILVNLCALLVFLLPGVNAIVFFVANAYLFGREYFELAALRYHSIEEVRRLRRAHAVEIFVAGLFIAAIVAVPLLNLMTPLFGTAFMVRVHRAMGLVPLLPPHDAPLRVDYARR